MPTRNILVLCGSLRTGSLNRMLANTLPELAPEGMRIAMAPEIGAIPPYNADDQGRDGFPEPVEALAEAIAGADGLIIVSPEYNYSVPGALKNAIDWVSRLPDQPFRDKPVALQSAAAGLLGGARMQYHLRQILVFLEAPVLTRPEVFVTFAKGKVDEERGVVTDAPTREMIAAQLAAFAGFVERFSRR